MPLLRGTVVLGTLLVGCGGGSQAPGDGSPGPDAPEGADAAETADPDTAGSAKDAMPEVTADVPGDAAVWRPLLDGVSFAGWQRYLGKPSAAEAPLGLENDPRGVFSFVTVDGAPALRISGEIWGALISTETFCNMHLRGQYKWGPKIWPSLGTRDAGLMYLSTGPLGAVNAGGPTLSDPIGSGAFMIALEYQITPDDVGAIAALGPIGLAVRDRRIPAQSLDDWNDLDITVRDGVITHGFGGLVVARGDNPVLEWPGQAPAPLTCGKLQLQSEGSEIFWRNVEIQAP